MADLKYSLRCSDEECILIKAPYEMEKMVTFLNGRVIPQSKRHSSKIFRIQVIRHICPRTKGFIKNMCDIYNQPVEDININNNQPN